MVLYLIIKHVLLKNTYHTTETQQGMDMRPHVMGIHPRSRKKVFYIWNNASENQALLSGGSCKGLAHLQFFASGKENAGDMNLVNRHFPQSPCLWRTWSKSFCGKKERKLLTKQSICTLRSSGEEMRGKWLCVIYRFPRILPICPPGWPFPLGAMITCYLCSKHIMLSWLFPPRRYSFYFLSASLVLGYLWCCAPSAATE